MRKRPKIIDAEFSVVTPPDNRPTVWPEVRAFLVLFVALIALAEGADLGLYHLPEWTMRMGAVACAVSLGSIFWKWKDVRHFARHRYAYHLGRGVRRLLNLRPRRASHHKRIP